MQRAAETPGLWERAARRASRGNPVTRIARRRPRSLARHLRAPAGRTQAASVGSPAAGGGEWLEARLLYVSTNHPAVRPGGLEAYTLRSCTRRSAAREEFEPIFIARAGPPFTEPTGHHWMVAVHDGQRRPEPVPLLHEHVRADTEQYDALFGTWRDKEVLTRFFRDFLLAQQPDIVHFQHTLFLGLRHDASHQEHPAGRADRLHASTSTCRSATGTARWCARKRERAVPGGVAAPLQRVLPRHRPAGPSTCASASSSRTCRWSTCFIAPSEYVRDRYVDWGIPAERIEVEPQGMHAGHRPSPGRGPSVAAAQPLRVLRPAQPLQGRGRAARRDGASSARTSTATRSTARISRSSRTSSGSSSRSCCRADGERHLRRPATTATDLGKLMARIDWVVVPSIWWETGPLVVMEAFQHGRPVICSDIGGMSEKVTDGVNGLHFRRRDSPRPGRARSSAPPRHPGCGTSFAPASLPTPPRWMHDHAADLTEVYKRLLDARAAAADAGPARGGRACLTAPK